MIKQHKKTWVAGFELLLIIVTVLVATYAWLTNNKQAEAKDLVIKTERHFNLLLSMDDGETWVTEASLNIPNNFEFKHEITGNGVNMYIPSNKRDDGTPLSFTNATAGSDYLEFSLMFKLAANVSVFLDNISFVNPMAGTEASDLIGTGVERISSSGDFSRDLIASSVRVAFIDNNYIDGQYVMNSTANLVWAPNKDYEVNCENECTASITSTNVQDYNYIEAANIPVVETRVNNVKDVLRASGEDQNANGDPILTTIDVNENDGVKRVTIRIWIEGNDRDNRNALTGGLFNMNMQFSAIMKGLDSVAPLVTVGTDNTISGYNNLMEYSIDYGLNWIKYEEENNPVFSEGDEVRVRKSETAEYFASSYTVLTY